MPLSNFIPKQLHDSLAAPLEHVLHLFSGAPQFDSTSATSKKKKTTLDSSETIGSNANLTPKSMPESRSPRLNKPLERLLEGSWESEIVIEDDEGESNKEIKRQTRPSLPKRSQLEANNLSHDPTRSHYRSQSSQEEDWLLGNASKTPADATRIQDPMARFREQQRGMGFRPMNTLHSSPTTSSSKNYFYRDKTRADSYSQPKTPKSKKSHEALHGPPPKKRRTGSFTYATRPTEIIHLEGSQDFDQKSIPAEKTRRNGRESDAHRPQPTSTTRQQASPQHASDLSESAKRVTQAYRENSPDELMDDDFVKETKRQRVLDADAHKTQQKLDGFFSSSPQPSHDEDIEGRKIDVSRVRRSTTATNTPHQSERPATRLVMESPDELQSESAAHDISDRNSRSQTSGAAIVEGLRKSRKPAKPQQSSQEADLLRMPVRALVNFGLPSTTKFELVISRRRKSLWIDYRDQRLSDDPLTPHVSFSKIDKILCPESDDCTVVIIYFRGSADSSQPLSRYMELATARDLRAFQTYIKEETDLKIFKKSGNWLRNAIAKANAVQDAAITDLRSKHEISSNREGTTESKNEHQPKRPRLAERLDRPFKVDQSSITRDSAKLEPDRTLNVDGQPIKRLTRHTRSSANLALDIEVTPEVPKKRIPRRTGPSWKNELVYPSTGRKRETVSWDDLARLEDDEFLNDNLVGLFLRYLQEHADQDQLKKMHFFSSFFYEKLTTNMEAKSNRRQINYKGVSSWTKNLNLFSRDFIIVPVNENLHWYVMIICNLPELKQQKTEEEEEDISMIDPPSSPRERTARSTLDDVGNDIEDLTADQAKSNSSLRSRGSDASRKGRRRSFKPMHRKYDVKKPIIITLDSLNIGRSTTATALKQYIVEEAQSKLQLDVEQSEIQGMTAKGIPLQSNYSDCGLYVCMYIEQFMRDPYNFVRRILQREDAGPQWPRRVESRDLRQKFYEMLQELHAAQEEKRNAVVAEIGSILVKMQTEEVKVLELQQLTAADVKSGADFYHRYKADTQRLAQDNEDVEMKTRGDIIKSANRTIEVSDGESPSSMQRTVPSRLSPLSRSKHFDISDIPAESYPREDVKVTEADDTGPGLKNHVQPSTKVVEQQNQATDLSDHIGPVDSMTKDSARDMTREGFEEQTLEENMQDEVPETPEMVIDGSISGDDDMLLKA